MTDCSGLMKWQPAVAKGAARRGRGGQHSRGVALPALLLMALVGVRCGGSTTFDPGGVGAAGSASGAPGAGSAAAPSHGAPDGGALGMARPCRAGDLAWPCRQDCRRELAAVRIESACVGGYLQCPAGSWLSSQCPLTSCLRSSGTCCRPARGEVFEAVCGSDDTYEACPLDARLLGPDGSCIPPQLALSDCSQLDALRCDDEGLRCASGGDGYCGTSCTCAPAPAGGLAWSCDFRTCP
jgi:hypothetical protein